MDSKLKRNTILSILLIFSIIFAMVIFLNQDKLTPKNMQASENKETSNGFRNGDEMSESELRAFLKDDTFFDEEKKNYDFLSTKRELSLQVISVEKDLRISVLNSFGMPVEGESFFVTLDGVGEYKDLDRDGIIYIGGLKAGNYSVSLNPIEGYQVPNGTINVAVKDKVEYAVIDDISFLIKSEDEIDVALEDTEEDISSKDSDETEDTLVKTSDGSYTVGIDVSKWNKEIDWEAVAEAGIDYAIIRVGYRGSATGSLVEDPYFWQNIDGAVRAGVKVGLYFFTQATNEVEAVEEASMAIALCNKYPISYPIFIDTEGAGGNGRADALDKETRTLVCDAFCKTIKEAGYTPGIYASKNWLNNNLNMDELQNYAIWLAEYKEAPTYDGEYHMWQYTSKGKVEGISTRVDLNISYLNP